MIEAGVPTVPVAVNEADDPTPAVEAVKVLEPTVVPSVGVQEAIPLALVVEPAHPATDPPPEPTAQVTATPDPTGLEFESFTIACNALPKAVPAVAD